VKGLKGLKGFLEECVNVKRKGARLSLRQVAFMYLFIYKYLHYYPLFIGFSHPLFNAFTYPEKPFRGFNPFFFSFLCNRRIK